MRKISNAFAAWWRRRPSSLALLVVAQMTGVFLGVGYVMGGWMMMFNAAYAVTIFAITLGIQIMTLLVLMPRAVTKRQEPMEVTAKYSMPKIWWKDGW